VANFKFSNHGGKYMYQIPICLGARISQSVGLSCLGFVVRFPAGARIVVLEALISTFIRL
jgi:hypothetical protein